MRHTADTRAPLEYVGGARRPPPVILLGEAGASKTLAASEIHRTGPRSGGPFVSVDVDGLPEELLEAVLYGHVGGCFDCREGAPGACHRAHGGTLLLDNVSHLSKECWGKIARVIETGTVRRLGSTRSEPADIWLILASTSLQTPIGQRTLGDVLASLDPVVLTVPPCSRATTASPSRNKTPGRVGTRRDAIASWRPGPRGPARAIRSPGLPGGGSSAGSSGRAPSPS